LFFVFKILTPYKVTLFSKYFFSENFGISKKFFVVLWGDNFLFYDPGGGEGDISPPLATLAAFRDL
jgi:hypothetical protein